MTFRALLSVFIFMIVSYVFVSTSFAAVLYVDQSNTSGIENGTAENPFVSIQGGIDDSQSGDVIFVKRGVYVEDLTIASKAIAIRGEDPLTTSVSGASRAISITGDFADNFNIVELSGLTIKDSSTSGIYTNATNNRLSIHNNIISGNNYGIHADSATDSGIDVINCTIVSNSSYGAYFNNSGNINVSNSIIAKNGTYGMYTTRVNIIIQNTNLYENVSGSFNFAIYTTQSQINNSSVLADFVNEGIGDYRLSSSSACIDAGRPLMAENDPDGTRNDQGAFGGPGAADFWPGTAGGPVVTELIILTPSIPSGGTLSFQATGEIE